MVGSRHLRNFRTWFIRRSFCNEFLPWRRFRATGNTSAYQHQTTGDRPKRARYGGPVVLTFHCFQRFENLAYLQNYFHLSASICEPLLEGETSYEQVGN